jgi:prepilin-type N-terminal cleavage/methylation domain-containing protein
VHGNSSLRSNPGSRRSSGFTLVELIISISLIGILAAVGSSMIADSFTTTRMVNANNASTARARYAMERLAREIREIKYALSGASTCPADGTTNNYCIISKTATNLQFTKTTVSGTDIKVTIDQTGSDLKLQYSTSPAVTATLSNNVKASGGLSLDYCDSTTTPPCGTNVSNANIRFVVITLTTYDPTSGQSVTERTRVALRNF